MCGCLLWAPTGDLACNPGTCPDWESNQWPFGSQAGTQSTEPHQPGPKVIVLMNLNFCVILNNAFLDWHHKDNAFSYDDKCFQVLSSHSQVSAHLERTRKSSVTEGSYRILLLTENYFLIVLFSPLYSVGVTCSSGGNRNLHSTHSHMHTDFSLSEVNQQLYLSPGHRHTLASLGVYFSFHSNLCVIVVTYFNSTLRSLQPQLLLSFYTV